MTIVLYFIIMVSFLDTFIQLPIITPYALELGASHFLAGSIVAIYSLTNMAGNIFGGHFIDRFGRKKVLLAGMLSGAFILFFYPFAQTGEQLFVIRLLHGIAGGVLIPAAFAYVGDQTKKGSRGKAMAWTGGCIGIAAIIGPAVGGIMAARAQIDYVFWLVAVLFLITSVLLVKFVEESFTSRERNKVALKHFLPLLKEPLLIQASLAAFGLMISNGTLAFALPLKVDEMGLDSATTGMLLSTFGIVAIIIFLSPVNRIYEKLPPINLVITGLVIIGLVHFFLNFIAILWVGILLMVIYGVGFALIFPSMNQIVSEVSTKVNRGKAYGIFYAFFSLGSVVGSTISGATAEMFGLPFTSSAAIILGIGVVLLVMSGRKK
ncbi:MFS family permease [Virgibacillus natechei]|uniref:MFS family permease n=1 Tax=Virgibacillus natechei TaxID=1216297 RepID=A0ABS4IH22_9BACI|nr:MFS transporter [Virgibacillus natechei]MBP1970258.1 MFS family permease [Virgibacillus natechei]UZD12797.1 MFS transporter [Virgibacillus natechei]